MQPTGPTVDTIFSPTYYDIGQNGYHACSQLDVDAQPFKPNECQKVSGGDMFVGVYANDPDPRMAQAPPGRNDKVLLNSHGQRLFEPGPEPGCQEGSFGRQVHRPLGVSLSLAVLFLPPCSELLLLFESFTTFLAIHDVASHAKSVWRFEKRFEIARPTWQQKRSGRTKSRIPAYWHRSKFCRRAMASTRTQRAVREAIRRYMMSRRSSATYIRPV